MYRPSMAESSDAIYFIVITKKYSLSINHWWKWEKKVFLPSLNACYVRKRDDKTGLSFSLWTNCSHFRSARKQRSFRKLTCNLPGYINLHSQGSDGWKVMTGFYRPLGLVNYCDIMRERHFSTKYISMLFLPQWTFCSGQLRPTVKFFEDEKGTFSGELRNGAL